jgi:cellulose synthase (UDP-forming)
MDQRLQYMVTATHYLTGIAPLLLLLVPPLEVYFDLRPMNLHISVLQWLLFYCGFYVLQIVLAFFTLGSFRWEVLMLATVSFPIYVKAFLNVALGKDVAWHVTGRKGAPKSPFNFIIPQVLFFAFLALTSLVAIWRDEQNGVLTLATVWNLLNTLILFSFVVVAFREARRLKLEARGLLRTELPAPAVDEPAQPRTVVARPVLRPADRLAAVTQLAPTTPCLSPTRSAEAHRLAGNRVAS